jgi:hypothetical protein
MQATLDSERSLPDPTSMNRGIFALIHLYSLGSPDSKICLYALTSYYNKRKSIKADTFRKYLGVLAQNGIAQSGQTYEDGDMEAKIDRTKLQELILRMKDSTSFPSQ